MTRKCPSIMHLTNNYTQKSFFWYNFISEEIVILEFLDPISLNNSQKFKDYLNNKMLSSRHSNYGNYTYFFTLIHTFTYLIILKECEIGILSNIQSSKLFQLAFSKSSSSKRMLAFLLASAACLSLA